MADELKEVSIQEMQAMLSEDPPAPQPKNDLTVTPDPEKSAAEAKPASPEAQPKPEISAEEKALEGDHAASESGSDKKETQEPKGEPKKPKGQFAPKEKKPEEADAVQKRINKAIWEKHDAERKREAAEREAADLRKKLEEKSQASGEPATSPKEEDKPAFQFDEPEPQLDLPSQDDYETLDDYLLARDQAQAKYTRELASWQYRRDRAQDQAQQKAEAAERQKAEANAKFGDRILAYAQKNPQIHEALSRVGPFLNDAGQADFIMNSEVGLDIVGYLNEHAEETLQLARSGNRDIVSRALGRIEERLLSTGKAPNPNPDTPFEELPEPPKVVGGKSTPASGVDLSDPKVSMDDWGKEFRRQLEAAS